MGLVLFRIDVRLFFPRVGLLCYIFFFFFQILVQIFFFLGFFFLLESRKNNGAKFNFIGIKKTGGVPKYFLKGRQIKKI